MAGKTSAVGWPLPALGLPARSAPRVLVLGLARSGLAAARLLAECGARLRLLALAPPDRAPLAAELDGLVARGAELRLGPHEAVALDGVDLIVKSPGVDARIPFLQEARRRMLPVIGELELAALAAEGPILAITGTNGKSTTTAWLGDMLRAAEAPVEVAGNIGRPLAEAVRERPGATFVVEVSSFQLEDTLTFRPRVAAILNLTPDHLDRHGTMEAYRAAKARIFRRQEPDDVLVLGAGGELDAFVEEARSRVLRAGGTDSSRSGVFHRDGALVASVPYGSRPTTGRAGRREDRGAAGADRAGDAGETRLLPLAELALPGSHNVENAAVAAAMALAIGAAPDPIRRSLRTFPGLPHRLERVGEIRGVACINDSKATNVDSLEVALRAFDEPVHLIAGGVGKGQDFRVAAAIVRDRTLSVHLIGEAAAEIARDWDGARIHRSASLAEALDAALSLARPGERIVLSPGCASFDQFRDFEDRGDRFRVLVQDRARASGGSR